MTFSRMVRPAALVVLAAGAVAVSTPSQAGLFEFLFGAPQRPAPQYYAPPAYDRQPLDVRVNPHRRRQQGAAKVRPGREKGPKVANTAIDPRKHPNWYLEDPTLKRGDIVVLPTGVMVYQGGSRPQTREDFAKLGDSRLVSKKEGERIRLMVGPPTVTAETDTPTTGKEASGSTNPVQ